ncbi:MAG: PilZ domain-containing protein [Tsuneonella sp.]
MDRRREARIEVNIAAACRIPAKPVRGQIDNVSYEGCRIRMSNANAEIGATALIQLPGCRPVSGIVVWKDRYMIGVCFMRRLDLAGAVAFGLAEPEPPAASEPVAIPATPQRFYARLHHWFRQQIDLVA